MAGSSNVGLLLAALAPTAVLCFHPVRVASPSLTAFAAGGRRLSIQRPSALPTTGQGRFMLPGGVVSPARSLPIFEDLSPEYSALAFPQQKRFGKSTALKTGTLSTGDNSKAAVNRLLLGFYFLAWYVLKVGYNIYVKKTLNVLPLPFTFAVIQLGAGAVWLLPQFLLGIRKVPEPSPSNIKALTQVAAFHSAGQLATVVAMGLG